MYVSNVDCFTLVDTLPNFSGVQSASRNPQSVSAIRAVSNLVPPIRHSSKTRLKPRDLYAEQGSFLALHDELITPAQIRYEWAIHQSNSKANSNVHHLRSPAIYIQGKKEVYIP